MRQGYQNDEFLRKRKERQRKIRKRRLKVFFVLFIIFLLVAGVILSLTVLFPIGKITAKGSKVYTSAQIIGACDIKKGDNLFSASEKEALNTLKKKLPFIKTVEFDRTLPDTLNITVTDAKEYACYKIDDEYFTVSADGWTLASYSEKPENIIEIKCDNVKCKVGSEVEFTADSSHESAQVLMDLLDKYDISIDCVDITNAVNLKSKVNGRFTVNFGTSQDLESKIKHLKSMMEEIGQNKAGKIDLSMWNSQNTQGIFVQDNIK